jgi:hypothetical protein
MRRKKLYAVSFLKIALKILCLLHSTDAKQWRKATAEHIAEINIKKKILFRGRI